jgi:hypothetical protein
MWEEPRMHVKLLAAEENVPSWPKLRMLEKSLRRAVCPRNTLYTEFGNYSLIDYVREEDQKTGDQTWRPVRTNWKNHRDDKIIGNCGGCNTPQLLDTYHVLCPSWYKDAFDGRDPY